MALNNFVKSIRNIMRNDAGINGDAQRIEQIAWMLFLKVYDEKENDWEFNEDNYVSFIPEECRWRNWAKDNGDGEALTGDNLLKSRCFTAQQLLDMDCNLDQCKFPKEEEEILPPAELLADYFKKRKALDHEIDKTLAEIQRILGIEINIEE